jgi:transposase InsO family protein
LQSSSVSGLALVYRINANTAKSNGLYKAELIHRRAPWKTREAVELATLEWASWFNHHRLLEPLRSIPPAEAEANHDKQLSSREWFHIDGPGTTS